MVKVRAVVVVALLSSACAGSPAAPAPIVVPAPVIPACQANNTADVTIANASPNNYTFDVEIDNVKQGTQAAPGQTFGPVTLAAGVDHQFVLRVAEFGVVGCISTHSFTQCTTQNLTCRF